MPDPYGLNYGMSAIAKGVTEGIRQRPLYQQGVQSGNIYNQMLQGQLSKQEYQMGQTQAANQALAQPQEEPESGYSSPYEQEWKMYDTAGKSMLGTPYASKGMELIEQGRQAQMQHMGYLGQVGAKQILGGDYAGASQNLNKLGVGIQDVKPAFGPDGSVDEDHVMVGAVVGKNDDGTPKVVYTPTRKTDLAALAESATPGQAAQQMKYIQSVMQNNMQSQTKMFSATVNAGSKVQVQELKNENAQSPFGKLFQDRNRPGVNMSDDQFNQSFQALLAKNKATSGKNAGIELTPEAVDDLAMQFIKTRELPGLGMGSGAARMQILNRVPSLAKERGITLDPGMDKAMFAANKKSLTDVQGMYDAVTAFENTASNNLDIFMNAAKRISDSDSPWVNKIMRDVDVNGLGSADQAAFNAAKRVAETEVAKVVSNPSLKGQLTDSQQKEMQQIMSGSYTFNQLKAVVNILKQDMHNRKSALEDKLAEVKGRMGTTPNAQPPSQTPSSGGSVFGPVGPSIKEGQTARIGDKTVKAVKGQWVYQ